MPKITSYKRSVILGVFLFLGLILFILGVFTIGSQRKIFSRTIRVRVIFSDIQGLQAGNNVWLSGMKIGTVKSISFCGDDQVEAILDIDRGDRVYIRKDAKARIGSDGLIGNRIVIIYGGTKEAGAISENAPLQGEKTINTEDMMTMLQENNRNLLAITGQFKEISRKINEGKGTIGVLLNDPAMGSNLRSALANIQTASRNSERLTAHFGALATDLRSGLNKPGGLVNELLNDTVVFQHLKETSLQLRHTATIASGFAEDLKQAGDRLNITNNPAGMLLQDEGVAADLKAAISHLRSSSEKLDEDLEALQHNFLFRGFFKKKARAEGKPIPK